MNHQLPPDATRIMAADDWDIYQSVSNATLYFHPTSYHSVPLAITHKHLAKLLLTSVTHCPDDLRIALENYMQDSGSPIESESISHTHNNPEPRINDKLSSQKQSGSTRKELEFTFGGPVAINKSVAKPSARKLWRNPWILGLLLLIGFIVYIEITVPPATPDDMLMIGSERVLWTVPPACNDHDKYEALRKDWQVQPDGDDFTAFTLFVVNHQCTLLPGGSTVKVVDFGSFDGVKVLVESDIEPSQYMNEYWVNRAYIPETDAPSASTSSTSSK